MTEQKFNTPSEIEVYINPKKNGVLTRDNKGFVDITEIRRGKKLHKLDNFKRDQKKFLEKTEGEIGEPPIKPGEKRSTWVHEKILERVLRWYEVDEEKVIDQFVHPKNRTIGSYQYDTVEIMIHLETKHINASKFCNIFNTSVKRWNELESTQNLLKLYCKTELDSEPEDPSAIVVKHGLGYDSNDVWIPHRNNMSNDSFKAVLVELINRLQKTKDHKEKTDGRKFCIRFNPKHNTNQSDGTIMYSKHKNPNHPTYKNLPIGTKVWIIGSGSKSGILMHKGIISKKTEYLPQADELNRFSKPEEYLKIPVWKFYIKILESPGIDIRGNIPQGDLRGIVSPVFKNY